MSDRTQDEVSYGPPLLWNELADLYDSAHRGRKARTLPMHVVFDWAESLPELFYVDPVQDTIHSKGQLP